MVNKKPIPTTIANNTNQYINTTLHHITSLTNNQRNGGESGALRRSASRDEPSMYLISGAYPCYVEWRSHDVDKVVKSEATSSPYRAKPVK